MTTSRRRKIVAVIGASEPSTQEAKNALEVGRLLGAAGLTVVSGGLGGVMEAVSRGVAEAGGTVIGIVQDPEPDSCNPYVEISIATGMDDGRNVVIANTADVFIAIGGSLGTLSEIAYALKRRKPVIGLGTWELDASRLRGEPWLRAETPEEAVRIAVQRLNDA